MNIPPSTYTNRKIWLSILFGVLSAVLSKYGIEASINEVDINLVWSPLLPVLVAMAWGWRYGLLAGISGGIYFPFILWPSDGWTNPFTSLIFLGYFIVTGIVYNYRQKDYRFLLLFATVIGISATLFLYFGLFFNELLSYNPPFWTNQTLNHLPQETILNFAVKDSISVLLITFLAETLLRINFVRKIMRLQVSILYKNNLKVFIALPLFITAIILIFISLSSIFLTENIYIGKQHIQIALLVITLASVFFSRFIFYFSETQLRAIDKLNITQKKYELLFKNANDAIVILKDGLIVECNSKTLDIFKCKKDDLINKSPVDFSPLRQPGGILSSDKARINMDNAIKGSPQLFEWQHKRLDNTLLLAEVSLNRIEINEEIFLQSIIRDVAEQSKLPGLTRKAFAAVEHSPATIIITDKKGNIEFVNPKFTELTGYSFEEAIGQNPRILKSGISSEKEYSDLWNTILSGNVWKGEFNNIKKNGEAYWESASIAPIFDEKSNITHFVAIKEDITEKKKVEQQLKESEYKYRSVFENLNDVYFVSKPDGTITDLSPTNNFHPLFNRDYIIGKNVISFYGDSAVRNDLINQLTEKGSVSDYEITFKTNSNTHVYCSVNAKIHYDEDHMPSHFEGVVRNITERKEAEKKIRINEKRFRKAQEIGNIGTYEYDFISKLYWGSDEAKRIFGLNLNSDFFTIDQIESCYVNPEELIPKLNELRQNKLSFEINYDIYRYKTRDRRSIRQVTEISRNEKGKPLLAIGLIVDITDQKRIENELIAAKEKAEESDKLKSAFLANMSHEIRTPMNGILGFSSLLKEPNLSGEEQKNYIEIIEKSGARMLNIIHNIIDISKIESGSMPTSYKDLNINKQIIHIYNILSNDAKEKNIDFSFTTGLSDSEAMIFTDEDKLYSIITNLINNAIKYTDKGSVEFGYIKDHDTLEFYIKDTGIGIAKDRQDIIFERFIQEDIEDIQARQGAGLGLSITKSFIVMLGGKIWLESKKGKGSTFYFTIPYQTAKSTRSMDENNSSNSFSVSHSKKPNILVAEDDEASQLLISEFLKDETQRILTVGNGKEAIEICRNTSDIDLVLMDIQMPELNGYEATRAIRQFNKDIIIIATTAFAQKGDKEKALKAGCNDYISKPYSQANLTAMITKHCKCK